MDAISQLDSLLGKLANEKNNIIDESDTEYVTIQRLVKDGYAERQYGLLYKITFDGQVFYQSGGYKVQTEKERASLRDSNLYRNQLLFLNWIIGLTGLVAAFYYSIEIWKFFHQK